ncbi:MAG TPA: ABC transporter substrate-binding protein [Candidatus Binatia bacterium]
MKEAAGASALLIAVLLAFSAAGAAEEKVKLPVSASSKTLGYSPLWVASRQGFFDRQGLDVQPVLVQGAEKSLMALVGGSVAIAGGAVDAPIAAVERGVDLVVIGGVINGLTHMIMGGKNYKTYEDLRGAVIGSSGLTSGTALVLRRVLKAKGLEYPRDYKLINVGGSGPAFAALASGQIAASIIAVPLSFEAAELGFNLIGRAADVIPNFQLTVLTARRSWAEANRPVVVRFMKAMALSMRWLYESKRAAIEFLTREMKLKPAHAEKGWEYYIENRIWHPDADVSVEGIKTVMQIQGEQSPAKGPPPSPARYIDQSYLREALKDMGSR